VDDAPAQSLLAARRDEVERHLLRRMQAGDERAARELWGALAPPLIAFARCAGAGAGAEDAVQRVFVSLLKLPRRHADAIESVRAYAAGALRNDLANAARSDSRRAARETAAVRTAPRVAASTDDHAELPAAVASLHDDARDLLLLKHVAGLTFDQLAIALGEPRTTIASRHAAAVGALRALMEAAAAPTALQAAGRLS